MTDLEPRKQTILRAIIIEYVNAAEPVASELISQKYALGVKSATVRNEMADLSEMGYLEQPHTSAGRIPSDQGYRYFVDHLIVRKDPSEEAKQRVAQAGGKGEALQMVLRDTARALSRVTNLLTVATTVRDADVTVRNTIVSAMSPVQALLVMVLSNGQVENRMIECPPGLTLEDIGRANEQMNQATAGKTLRSLTKAKSPSPDKFTAGLWSNIRNIARELTRGVMITEGEEFMFAQPEFQRNVGALNELLTELTESDVLYESIAPGEQAQPVTIGREHRDERMRQLSVVRHSFYVGENEAGVIALVGPTRMRYESSIPLVNYSARALSESLTRFFG